MTPNDIATDIAGLDPNKPTTYFTYTFERLDDAH